MSRRCSSVHVHLGLVAHDGVTASAPVIGRFPALAERIGRPVGDAAFIAALERHTSRTLGPARPGPKPKGRRDRDLTPNSLGASPATFY